MRLNCFADRTYEELQASILTLKATEKPEFQSFPDRTINGIKANAIKVDGASDLSVRAGLPSANWKPWCTAVKNQGNCGSCWAFSSIATIEWFGIYFSRPRILSDQQILDCAGPNSNCGGGYISDAFVSMINVGVTSSSAYPYVGYKQSCRISGGSTKINQAYYFAGCSNLKYYLNYLPVAVGLWASQAFMYYGGGIFGAASCSIPYVGAINHAIALVGYDDNIPTWTIKNSWSSQWGESGYMRMQGNYDTCNICSNYGFGATSVILG